MTRPFVFDRTSLDAAIFVSQHLYWNLREMVAIDAGPWSEIMPLVSMTPRQNSYEKVGLYLVGWYSS